MLANRTASQPSTFVMSVLDDAGHKAPATSAVWELFDARGASIASGEIDSFDPTEDTVTFTVPAESLALDVGQTSAGREIVVTLIADDDETEVRDYFVLVNPQPLSLMQNSFMTYPEALAVSQEFGSLNGWSVNDQTRRAAALAEGYRRICRMSFRLPRGPVAQSNVNYAAYGTGSDDKWLSGNRVRLSTLTVEEFDALPEGFRRALKRAQIAEADAMLGGDPVGDKRRAGLISETVGESSMFFQSKPYLNLPVSKPAYEELKRYVYLKIGIHRA